MHAPVGSERGAVPGLRRVRFPAPPAEPDVRLSPHPALHKVMPGSWLLCGVPRSRGWGSVRLGTGAW
ncbi:hypothetical protein ER308_01850 [Egibacter rhizosphaerae]|uniref:Uncharacterized protein n=1 Tax=Egibacter rhizosphaerae TaxID=1670831 RepID=A0A411YB19_9ACTN|nr:hypothetical protein ER308_01850 [Egibacter rhizosphaerae]